METGRSEKKQIDIKEPFQKESLSKSVSRVIRSYNVSERKKMKPNIPQNVPILTWWQDAHNGADIYTHQWK